MQNKLEQIKQHYVSVANAEGNAWLKSVIREAIGKAYELGLSSQIVSLQEEIKSLKEQLKDE